MSRDPRLGHDLLWSPKLWITEPQAILELPNSLSHRNRILVYTTDLTSILKDLDSMVTMVKTKLVSGNKV